MHLDHVSISYRNIELKQKILIFSILENLTDIRYNIDISPITISYTVCTLSIWACFGKPTVSQK